MRADAKVADGDTAAVMRAPRCMFSPNYAGDRSCSPSGSPYRMPPLTQDIPDNNSATAA
jgi:hypothetical protein